MVRKIAVITLKQAEPEITENFFESLNYTSSPQEKFYLYGFPQSFSSDTCEHQNTDYTLLTLSCCETFLSSSWLEICIQILNKLNVSLVCSQNNGGYFFIKTSLLHDIYKEIGNIPLTRMYLVLHQLKNHFHVRNIDLPHVSTENYENVTLENILTLENICSISANLRCFTSTLSNGQALHDILSHDDTLISHNFFMSLADIAITSNSFCIPKKNSCNIIYIKTEFLSQFMAFVRNYNVTENIIIISGLSALNLVPDIFSYLEQKNIVAIFSKNVDFMHNKLLPIPCGLGDFNFNEKQEQLKQAALQAFSLDIIDRKRRYKRHQGLSIYCNVSFITNDVERRYAVKKAEDLGVAWSVNANGKLTYLEYTADLSESTFVLCPQGAGIDIIRIWESLFVGAYPIVLTSFMDQLFDQLPVLILKDWDELNLDILSEALIRFENSIYSYDVLSGKHWKNKIFSMRQRVNDNFTVPQLFIPLQINNDNDEGLLQDYCSNIGVRTNDFFAKQLLYVNQEIDAQLKKTNPTNIDIFYEARERVIDKIRRRHYLTNHKEISVYTPKYRSYNLFKIVASFSCDFSQNELLCLKEYLSLLSIFYDKIVCIITETHIPYPSVKVLENFTNDPDIFISVTRYNNMLYFDRFSAIPSNITYQGGTPKLFLEQLKIRLDTVSRV